MKAATDHLGKLVLGYMWNHPVQKLNELLSMRNSEKMAPELVSALRKLTIPERKALKEALVGIFTQDISELFLALDETVKHGEPMEIGEGDDIFNAQLPPWEQPLSYFDREGNPKPRFVT